MFNNQNVTKKADKFLTSIVKKNEKIKIHKVG